MAERIEEGELKKYTTDSEGQSNGVLDADVAWWEEAERAGTPWNN